MIINKSNFIRELLKKNEKALEFVIDEYGALINGIVRNVLRSLGDNGIIEECLSDILFSVWENIEKFKGDEDEFKYWVAGLSKYKAIDYYRKYSKKSNTIVYLEENEDESNYNLEKDIIQNIETNEVIKLINKLKEPDKSIFVMKFLFDYSTKKIADILGLSISNINTKISRGREKLKREYKFDFSEEIEEPINDLDKKRLKNNLKLKIKKDKTNRRKKLKQILITALIALIILSGFSPIGKKVIAEIKEKLFFNPGLGVVSTEEELYILESPLMVDENFLIKSISSEKSGIYVEIWFKPEGAKKLKEINKEVKVKIGDEFILTESYASSSGGDMDFASLYFKAEEIFNEVTLLIYDQEVKVKLEKPEVLYGYDEVGVTSFDNEILLGINKYFFNNKTYLSLWARELYENDEITSLSFNAEDIIAIDSEGKKYEVLSSPTSGNGREFYINEIVDKPLEIKISKLSLDYSIEDTEVIKVDIPKKNEVIEVNKEVKIESLNKSFIIKEVKAAENENGEVIEVLIDLSEDSNKNSNIILMYKSFLSSYSMGDSQKEEMVYGITMEDLSSKEKMFNKVNLKFNRFTIEKSGEWNFTLE